MSHKKQKRHSKKLVFIIVGILVFIFSYSIIFIKNRLYTATTLIKNEAVTKVDQDKPVVGLVNDIAKDLNTSQTKAEAYSFVTRYFQNGGDIYEVYNSVESNPELLFLKEAEGIYPKVFDLIKKRRLPFTYSDEGMYAYLAYLEVLEAHGYGDVATQGALVHQYVKMAYYKKMILEDKSKGKSLEYPNYTKKDITNDIKKATQFTDSANVSVSNIINGEELSKESIPSEIVTGLIQYASGLRYFESMNIHVAVVNTSKEVFSFVIKYAHTNVPAMYLFASLSNASTLLLSKNLDQSELRNAIYPFFDIKNGAHLGGLLKNMLDARFNRNGNRFRDLDIYSFNNISSLASKVPEFKVWLMRNGWTDADFK